MPLGNPIRKQNESRIISVLATEGQSVFTVEGGYIINQISVFRNGVRLSNSEDFTAGDGSTVTLNNEANVDDRIEFHVFDRFTVQNAIVGAASTQTISGDLVINGKIFGNLDVPSINTGILTATSGNFTGGSLTITGTTATLHLIDENDNPNYRLQNNNGQFRVYDATSDTSRVIVNGDGNTQITGDSNIVGVTTVGKQVHVGTGVSIAAGGLNVTAGISTFQAIQGTTGTFSGAVSGTTGTFTGDVDIADTILHTGDTNTKIRFPAADTVTVETGGTERLRINSDGAILKGLTTGRAQFFHSVVNPTVQIEGTGDFDRQVSITSSSSTASRGAVQILAHQRSGSIGGNTILQADDVIGLLSYQGNDGTNFIEAARIECVVESGVSANDMPGDLRFSTNSGTTSASERLRIDSNGKLLGGNYFTSKQIGAVTASVQIQGTSADTSALSLFRYSNDTGGSRITLGKGRGTSGGAVDKPQENDTVGTIHFHIANNNDLVNGNVAAIDVQIDAEPGGADTPGRIRFLTSPDGSSTLTERLRIDSNGRALIGTTSEGHSNADDLTIATAGGSLANTGITIRSSTTGDGNIFFSDATSGDGETKGVIKYKHDGDTLRFHVGGEEHVRFNSGSSTELIRISGPIDASTQQEFGIGIAVNDAHTHPAAQITFKEYDASDSRGDLLFYTRGTNNDVASTERVRIDSSGYLIAKGDIRLRRTASNNGALYFGDTNNNYIFGSDADDLITFATAGSERFRIASNGQLNLAGNMQFTAANPELEFNNGGPRFRIPSANTLTVHTGGGLGATSNERLRIASNGVITNSLSSDNTTAVTLSNNGTTGGHVLKLTTGGTGAGTHTFSIFRNNQSSEAEVFRIDGSGDKFMDSTFNKTANNARKSYFTISGQLIMGRNAHESYLVFQDVSNTQIGNIVRGAGSSVAYNTSSDYRLKENVVAISDGITRLKTLKPSRFNFKSDSSITFDGFLAHEVTAVPEAITGTKDEVDSDNNPVYQGIDQSKLVPLLTAALQEAVAKIETLETKVAALEGS